MSNVIQFGSRKPKPQAQVADVGEVKIQQLTQAEADEDFGLYVWMLREYAKFLHEHEPAEGVDYLKDILAYEAETPSPGVVKFKLFGWSDISQPRTEKPGEGSLVFVKIDQTKLEEIVEPNYTKAEMCLAKLRAFVASWGEHVAGPSPMVQFMAPMMFIGYICSTGAFIAHYRVPTKYDDKILVVLQHPRFSTEYRLEIDYSALMEPKK
jgi:hypothetical protein